LSSDNRAEITKFIIKLQEGDAMARLTRQEKGAQIEEQQARLDAEKKAILAEIKAANDKERTHRLCKRHGLLESLLPDTIKLADKYYNEYVQKIAVTDAAKKILADLLAEQELEAEIKAEEVNKPAETKDVEIAKSAPQTTEKPAAGNLANAVKAAS
jgi:hypothetical protein